MARTFGRLTTSPIATLFPRIRALSDVMGKYRRQRVSCWKALWGMTIPCPTPMKFPWWILSLYDETISAVTAIDGGGFHLGLQPYRGSAQQSGPLWCATPALALWRFWRVVSLFIISNTVKVTIFSRRMEINIMKSVGRYQRLCPSPLYCGGPDYWHCVRPCFGHHSLLCLRSGGSRGDQSGSPS